MQYKGTGNSHNTTKDNPGGDANQVVEDGKIELEEKKEGAKKEKLGRKEKSVLQAKLTRLAIQIGYAGNVHL